MDNRRGHAAERNSSQYIVPFYLHLLSDKRFDINDDGDDGDDKNSNGKACFNSYCLAEYSVCDR